MKRRNAIILFGTLTLMCVGYVAWCGRCFYLKPGLEFPPHTPAGVREQFEHWHAHTRRNHPVPIDAQGILHHLMHPGTLENRYHVAYQSPPDPFDQHTDTWYIIHAGHYPWGGQITDGFSVVTMRTGHSAEGPVYSPWTEFLEYALPGDPVCPKCGQAIGFELTRGQPERKPTDHTCHRF